MVRIDNCGKQSTRMKSYSPQNGFKALFRISPQLALKSISIEARSMIDETMCNRSLIHSMHSLIGAPSFFRTSIIAHRPFAIAITFNYFTPYLNYINYSCYLLYINYILHSNNSSKSGATKLKAAPLILNIL